MNVTRYLLKLRGISPLVMNSNAALLTGGEDKGRDPARYEREHYMDKTYRDASGNFIIPARALKKSMIEACKFLPMKPKGVNFKSFGPFIQSATLFPFDAMLDVKESAVKPLTLVVNLDPSKGTKGPRGPRTRPCIAPPWYTEVEIHSLDPILTYDVLSQIAEKAGLQVGFLDGRSIDFGRASVTVDAL